MATGQDPGGFSYAFMSRGMVQIAAEIAAAPTQEAKNALRQQYASFINAHNRQFGPDYIGALPVPPIPAGRYTRQSGTGRKKKTTQARMVKAKKQKGGKCACHMAT